MAKTPDTTAVELGKISKELEATKKLLILLLMKLGTSSDEIGLALGVTGRAVRKTIPSSKVKKLDVGPSPESVA